jgi:hypothetical protein
MIIEKLPDPAPFLGALGCDEEPMGMFFTDREPPGGYTPKPGPLPSVEAESRNEIDWKSLWENFSCVIGHIWLARKKKTAAYFDRERFGCVGGAFFLGFMKPQLSPPHQAGTSSIAIPC